MRIIPRRRRLENKTNYTKRKKLLEGRKPRVVVRKSNKYVTVQYVTSKAAQDKIEVSITSKELLKMGWPKDKEGSLKSLGAAYLAGFLFGKKVAGKPLGILDTGLIRSTPGSRIYAIVNGIVDAGFKMPHNAEVFPDKERINSENLKSFFDKVKLNIEKGAK